MSTKQLGYCCFCLLFYLGRLSSVTTLKLNDNCLSSLPFSIGGYRLFGVLCTVYIKLLANDTEASNITKALRLYDGFLK